MVCLRFSPRRIYVPETFFYSLLSPVVIYGPHTHTSTARDRFSTLLEGRARLEEEEDFSCSQVRFKEVLIFLNTWDTGCLHQQECQHIQVLPTHRFEIKFFNHLHTQTHSLSSAIKSVLIPGKLGGWKNGISILEFMAYFWEVIKLNV